MFATESIIANHQSLQELDSIRMIQLESRSHRESE
jgi:aryl carrier-like protein